MSVPSVATHCPRCPNYTANFPRRLITRVFFVMFSIPWFVYFIDLMLTRYKKSPRRVEKKKRDDDGHRDTPRH